MSPVANIDRQPVLTGKSLGRLLVCIVGIGLGGCASTGGLHLTPDDRPVKVLVLESPLTIDPGRLQKVVAPDSKTPLSPTDAPLADGSAHAQAYALATMQAALGAQPDLAVVSAPAAATQLLDRVRERDMKSGLTQAEADQVQQLTGADAVLKFTLTDYGLTPTAWRNGYITFEVTTTLGLAAIIAYSGSTVAKAAAGAYLVQEAIEETAEAYAGFWALDVVCRPVRIEAELIRLQPVMTVWAYHDTGLSDVRLARLTSTVTVEERIGQLDQASGNAVGDIVTTLANALNDTRPQRQFRR